jgi:hypothetical protein
MHPIADKAEVAIDFPGKLYMGGFGRDSAFEARAEPDAVLIRLVRPGGGDDRREAEVHLHHLLFAGILDELAGAIAAREPIDDVHREPLLRAARRLVSALERQRGTPATAPCTRTSHCTVWCTARRSWQEPTFFGSGFSLIFDRAQTG